MNRSALNPYLKDIEIQEQKILIEQGYFVTNSLSRKPVIGNQVHNKIYALLNHGD